MTHTGRILALDIGKKRVGLALSDALRITAQPFGTIEISPTLPLVDELHTLIQKEHVVLVVLGMPRRLDGSMGEMAERVKDLASQIRRQIDVDVRLWDERFSTHAAERALLEGKVSRKKRKKVIDQTAAAWILQGFLDSGQAG